MDLVQAVRGRRSVRKYKDIGVSDAVIEELIDLARYSPSSMDGQPWHFVVIRDPKTKAALAKIKNKYCPVKKKQFKADFLKKAPLIIIVCVDKERSYDREIENAVLATAYIMLGAQANGLNSVYMSAYKDDEPGVAREIRDLLSIPEKIDPVTLIPMGYPDEKLDTKKIRDIKEMIHHENFSSA
jgi:nitroreductase